MPDSTRHDRLSRREVVNELLGSAASESDPQVALSLVAQARSAITSVPPEDRGGLLLALADVGACVEARALAAGLDGGAS